jgi:hypothetical protein
MRKSITILCIINVFIYCFLLAEFAFADSGMLEWSPCVEGQNPPATPVVPDQHPSYTWSDSQPRSFGGCGIECFDAQLALEWSGYSPWPSWNVEIPNTECSCTDVIAYYRKLDVDHYDHKSLYKNCCDYYENDGQTEWINPDDPGSQNCPVIDADGDGIPDDEDPFPDDAGGFTWKLTGQILDEYGNPVKSFYEVCNSSGQCKQITIGDGEGGFYAQIANGLTGTETNAPWLDQSQLLTEGGHTTETIEGDGNPDYLAGDDDSGDGTDNALLGQIANNTQRSVDNQGEMGKQLEAIASKNDMANSLLAEIATNTNEIANKTGDGQGTEVNIDTPTAEEIGGAVEDALSNDEGVDYSTAQGDQTAIDSAYNEAITGINEQLVIGDAPEDMQQKTDIEDKFGDLMINQDLQDAQNVITGSGVNLSGNCSFTYDYKGHPITFSVCSFENQIDMMGNVLLSIAGLTSILIVFRRG